MLFANFVTKNGRGEPGNGRLWKGEKNVYEKETTDLLEAITLRGVTRKGKQKGKGKQSRTSRKSDFEQVVYDEGGWSGG